MCVRAFVRVCLPCELLYEPAVSVCMCIEERRVGRSGGGVIEAMFLSSSAPAFLKT